MSKLSDTKIPITDFLEAYRRQPCLYNSLLDTYKNRVSREEAYEGIIRALKIPQLTVVDIKLKIKSVRTVYSKELRIWMREKELGRSYEPKLFWFKLADSFLRSVSLSHCKRVSWTWVLPCFSILIFLVLPIPSQTKGKQGGSAPETPCKSESPLVPSSKMLFNATADISMSEDALEGEEEEEEPPPEPEPEQEERFTPEKPTAESNCLLTLAGESARKSELVIDDSSLCLAEQQQQQQQQQQLALLPPNPTLPPPPTAQRKLKWSSGLDAAGEDELVIFGQSIASQLRTISDSYSRSVAKLRIQQVLFEAETGQFQNNEASSPAHHQLQLQH
ncbi:hypothetical protein KR009_007079, partial [Drosophila setifemur]